MIIKPLYPFKLSIDLAHLVAAEEELMNFKEIKEKKAGFWK